MQILSWHHNLHLHSAFLLEALALINYTYTHARTDKPSISCIRYMDGELWESSDMDGELDVLLRESYEGMEMLVDLEVGACGLCSTARCAYMATGHTHACRGVKSNCHGGMGSPLGVCCRWYFTSLADILPSPCKPEFQCSGHMLPVIADTTVIGIFYLSVACDSSL